MNSTPRYSQVALGQPHTAGRSGPVQFRISAEPKDLDTWIDVWPLPGSGDPRTDTGYQLDAEPPTDMGTCQQVIFVFGERTENIPTIDDPELFHLSQIADHVRKGLLQHDAFFQAVQAVDWCNRSILFFKQVIELALQLEMPSLAYEIAADGYGQYPTSEDLQRAARVLAPPEITERNRPPKANLKATMQWLKEHSAEYRNRWVALRGDVLLAEAASRADIVEQLGDLLEEESILITRIL